MCPKIISFDIESIDYEGNYTDYPTQIACASDGWCYVSKDNEQSVRSMIEALMEAHKNGAVLVGHNSWQFDSTMIRKFGYPEFPLGEDTMVLAYLEDETQPKGLESLCVKHLGIKGWKDEFEHPLGSDGFALYNARDVVYTLRLYKKLLGILGDRVNIARKILQPAFVALSSMSSRGIYINPEAVQRERLNAEAVVSTSLARVREIVGDKDFNPSSPKQVGEYLERIGEILPLTATGKSNTSVKVLKELDTPFTDAVLEYRGAVKTLGTYVENYEKLILADGRVHPEYKITRTLTGRSSATNQNVQNLPREYKDFFGAPSGRVFCEVDWSAIEFRVAAWVAQEPTILQNFKEDPNWDPHLFFALRFYREETIKTANLWAMLLGLPTDGLGSEILSSVLSAMGEGKKAREILEDIYWKGWSWNGELPAPQRDGSERLQNWHRVIQSVPEKLLRELQSRRDFSALKESQIQAWEAFQPSSSSQGSQPKEQRSFKFTDALSALSSNPSPIRYVETTWNHFRQVAKSANFGLTYLGTGFTLVDYAKGLGIELSLPTADALHRQWHDTFPGMRKLYRDTKDEILKTSEARTATGFIRHFGDISIMPYHLRSEALRQGVNVKVQGFAAHIAYVAMARLHELGMPLTGFIHDAFLFEFEDAKECEEKLPIIEGVMCNYPRQFFNEHFGFDLDVPLTVEAKWRVC